MRCAPFPIFCLVLYSTAAAQSSNYSQGADWEAIRAEIIEVLDNFPGPDEGHISPSVVRLAWHSAATFDPHNTPHGGSNGATMRYEPEKSYPDNKGLELARKALAPIQEHHPISFSDLWVFAGYVAIEHLGGPHIDFRPGREDQPAGAACPPDERMPQFDDSANQVRAKFERMGMSSRDMVALMGGHTLGHTHPENSGFPEHSWDGTPLAFDNRYYTLLRSQHWMEDGEGEHKYFRNRSWIMLLTDHLMIEEADLKKYVDEFADDEGVWFSAFASAFKRLTEMGMDTSTLAVS